jgi:hypothetical protein
MDYSLAELTKIIGAKRRTVQLWAEGGVIQALPGTDRAGTGTHRRFSRDEAIIGCFVHAFSGELQLPIGVLIRLSRTVRGYTENPRFTAIINKAIANQAAIYATLRSRGAPEFLLTEAGGAPRGELSIAIADASAARDKDDLHRLLGKHATEVLGAPKSFALCVRVNEYLKGLA